jgi:septal ring factor EnvC (AmiA/AmiB activator)
MMRWIALVAAAAAFAASAYSAQASRSADARALADAKAEADAANNRYRSLQRQAQQATSAAARARAESEALAARIEAAEADLTAAERRIAIIETMQAVQHARLAERQQPLVRLTAALQTMARRPAALALVQPGSVEDTVHVRSLLAATLPEIRRRTAALRAEVARGNALRGRAEEARGLLAGSREALRGRRAELAAFEAQERSRSSQLAGLALSESDRALAFGEEARTLAQTIGTRAYQAQLETGLSQLPGPLPRPGGPGGQASPRLPYGLPVTGRLVTGVGEISDGGVHSRGLTFATQSGSRAVAPANGRVLYAAPFRSYGNVVIIDHGRGWSTVVTNLGTLDVAAGQSVRRGATLGRTGSAEVTVELRRAGRPVPIAQLIGG